MTIALQIIALEDYLDTVGGQDQNAQAGLDLLYGMLTDPS